MESIAACVVALALFATATPLRAAGLEELSLYPSIQYFTWEEFDRADSRIVKEEGPLYGLGVAMKADLASKVLLLTGKTEIFGGEVKYDGATLAGAPVRSNVDYVGINAALDLGYRLQAHNLSLEPFAGLGYRWWHREIQATVISSTTTEEWDILSLRLGARGECRLSPAARLFIAGGAKYPWFNRNVANPDGGSDETFHPGRKWSAFAEAGGQFGRIRPAFFYEGFRFGDSPTVGSFYQPRTNADIVGISVGFAFR
ncbi:hypothetical protein GURASL_09240 [Geotalea uraniireducens]|uniref:Outer membrane protein beta-barrel domain-containing protein n=1 Tax=Geotalea uraniireducens TaxID=351604 RepID=A0ABM8EHU0_9BACT|nr:hypothetical protein [Geotalea uraniireducens]BDV42001.1 hypothetical protein GURASL_09240 [Geotalea uraniireducens]